MSTELLSIITGIMVFIIIMAVFQDKRDLDSGVAKRLHNIKTKSFESANNDDGFANNMKVLMQDTEYKIRILGTILDKVKLTSRIKRMLKMADFKMTVDIFLVLSFSLALPFIFLALIKPQNSLAFLSIGIGCGFIPFFIVKIKIKKRHDMFTQQLPEGLGLISSSLRAGHSLQSAFQMVVLEMPDPISSLFKVAVDDISLGIDTKEALNNMILYMPGSVDLRFFITAVLIQREIGGNLAEILDSLSYTIRERFKLIGQLKTQTAQAKLSGIVLALAPVVIGLAIWFLNPSYMEPLFNTLLGQMALGASFAMAIIGFLVIKKITNIKI